MEGVNLNPWHLMNPYDTLLPVQRQGQGDYFVRIQFCERSRFTADCPAYEKQGSDRRD